jgi:glycosyltransferase involved in cell wall biosynthesis
MKILFLVYHGFSDVSGISKKIHYQVKGLRENGHDVHLCSYGFTADGRRCRFVDDTILADYGKGMLAGLRQRTEYGKLFDYCRQTGIEFVYARCFQNANPWLIRFFRRLRLAGIRAVTEIPTYPYDQEFAGFEWKMRLSLKVDQLFRRRLYRQTDALVTFSNAERIFGQRTIRISNGVDFDSIPLHRRPDLPPLHLIGVAEVHEWHGFDRVMTGMGVYYNGAVTDKDSVNGRRPTAYPDVFFHVVGDVHPHLMDTMFRPVIEKYGLQDKVIFHGALFGDALTAVFNQCQFAIGSLGRHRSGITAIKTLKNREYATRGIPFIYSEQDSDFDQQPYVLKAPADESPVDISRIVSFTAQFHTPPSEIRHTVEHLAWKRQMQIVVEAIQNEPGTMHSGTRKRMTDGQTDSH